MKKKYRMALSSIALTVLVLIIYSYFHVSGGEIKSISNMSPNSSVTIIKSNIYSDLENRYILTPTQIEKFRDLVLQSTFTICLSQEILVLDTELYKICIKDTQEDFSKIIESIGNQYISVLGQFNNKFLKIKNPKWEESLKSIIKIND